MSDEIYRVEDLPVFQNRMFTTAQSAIGCRRGNVVLVQDKATGLIYNRDFDASLLDYDGDYQNEQGSSKIFQQHLDHVSLIIAKHLKGQSLIEVGCGKALFFEKLQAEGYDIVGLDPAYEGNNPAIRKEYFSPSIGMKADGLILRHVLEHVADPISFLMLLRDSNAGQGKIYIEVPCLDWIADNRAWFDIFYEHVNYFRLNDFQRIFGKVHEAQRTFGGQYLSIVADLGSIRRPAVNSAPAFVLPKDFKSSVSKYAALLTGKQGITADGAQNAIWGGASKGVTFGLFMTRLGIPLDIVVDVSTAKQGKFLPGTGLRVHSPEEALQKLAPNADIFVMNPNYIAEIKEMTGRRFNYIAVNDSI